MLLKSRALPDTLPFNVCIKKRLAIRHMSRPPLSNDTIDSVLRHRKVGRSKDVSIPQNKTEIRIVQWKRLKNPYRKTKSKIIFLTQNKTERVESYTK